MSCMCVKGSGLHRRKVVEFGDGRSTIKGHKDGVLCLSLNTQKIKNVHRVQEHTPTRSTGVCKNVHKVQGYNDL